MKRRTFFKRLGMLAAAPFVAKVSGINKAIYDATNPVYGYVSKTVFVGVNKNKMRDGTFENPFHTIDEAIEKRGPGICIMTLSTDPPCQLYPHSR